MLAKIASPSGTAGLFENTGSGKLIRGLSDINGVLVERFSVENDGTVAAIALGGDGSGLSNVGGLDCSSCVRTRDLGVDIGQDDLATDSVGSDEIQADSVGTLAIAPFAVTDDELDANDPAGSDEFAPNSIGADELDFEAVDSAAIEDGAVTRPKIPDGDVSSEHLSSPRMIYEQDPACADSGFVTFLPSCSKRACAINTCINCGTTNSCGGDCSIRCNNSLLGWVL